MPLLPGPLRILTGLLFLAIAVAGAPARHQSVGYHLARFLLGLGLLVACGLGGPSALLLQLGHRGPYQILDVILGTLGFWLAFTTVTPLVHDLSTVTRLRHSLGDSAHAAFAGASTAQRVFLLLLAVAEADGQSGPAERELVRSFLRSRFADQRQRDDIDSWSHRFKVPRDLTNLASLIARTLDRGECATLYSWSCLVAFADGNLQPPEHAALQQIARGFGLPPHHAMFLFEFAQQAARRQRFGSARTGPDRQERTRPADGRSAPPPPPTSMSARARALATLGLPADASPQSIRRRHRELVRQCHPDAHRTLGPIAQREATERFLAIQQAYEVLTS